MKDVIRIIRPQDCDTDVNETDTKFEYWGTSYKIVPLGGAFNLQLKRNQSTRIILIKVNREMLSFFVDRITEVVVVDETSSKKLFFSLVQDEQISGIVKYEGREIKVPNFGQLISHSN